MRPPATAVLLPCAPVEKNVSGRPIRAVLRCDSVRFGGWIRLKANCILIGFSTKNTPFFTRAARFRRFSPFSCIQWTWSNNVDCSWHQESPPHNSGSGAFYLGHVDHLPCKKRVSLVWQEFNMPAEWDLYCFIERRLPKA